MRRIRDNNPVCGDSIMDKITTCLILFCGIVLCLKGRDAMTTLENFYFGNINPSEYRQSKDTRKKLSEMTSLFDELKKTLTTAEQQEILEQIDNCQLSLISLSEGDAFIEGFKLGVKMATEIYRNE